MRRISLWIIFLTFGAFCHPGHCSAGEILLRSAGVRGGLSDCGTDINFRQYEAFAIYQLPWELRSGSGWGVSTQLSVTAGALSGDGELGFVGSAGPAFGVGRTGFPLEMDLGVSVAVLSRDTFGHRDLNGYGQFVSHAGLNYRFGKRLGLGYRFQHMSNAGFNGCRNPGLNMHLLGLSWYFAE